MNIDVNTVDPRRAAAGHRDAVEPRCGPRRRALDLGAFPSIVWAVSRWQCAPGCVSSYGIAP